MNFFERFLPKKKENKEKKLDIKTLAVLGAALLVISLSNEVNAQNSQASTGKNPDGTEVMKAPVNLYGKQKSKADARAIRDAINKARDSATWSDPTPQKGEEATLPPPAYKVPNDPNQIRKSENDKYFRSNKDSEKSKPPQS